MRQVPMGADNERAVGLGSIKKPSIDKDLKKLSV